MPADLHKARELFLHAVGKLPPEAWDAYVAEACGGDAGLAQQVGRFLQVHREAGSFLESPALALVATTDEACREGPGTVIGPYRLLEQLGEGGFGVVFLAEQTQPVRRQVALKVIKPGMDSRQVIARFEAERQALALMDHPHIARVLDAGTTANRRPYFVMELVEGVPFTRYCDEHRLTPRQRLELFVSVCQAVQHAHQKGVIHRDLKPSNVLVTEYDGRPVPKVIDFGVAKAIERKLTDGTQVTEAGTLVGTLEHMSPEQAQLDALDIDTRSDIYALGVLLYELLTGTTPLERKRLREATLLEVLRLIREEEPPTPSTRLSTIEELPAVASNRGVEPRKLSGVVRGELDWIVMKCLDKDRNRRYETASALALDIERYLADEPVRACPPSAWYRLRKFVRRNRGPVLAAAVVLLAVVLGGGSWAWLTLREAARRAAAEGLAGEALEEAERLSRKGDWPEAKAKAKRAEGLLESSGSPELRERARHLLADLAMVTRLEEVRFLKSEVVDDHFDFAGADAEYAKEFRAYGVDVLGLGPAEAAGRLRGRSIALVLAAALDDWADVCRQFRKGDDPTWKRLLAVARAADPDLLRNELRDAWGLEPDARRKALKRLAKSRRLTALPAPTLVLLGDSLRRSGAIEQAVSVLRQAQEGYPADFWINNCLGFALDQLRPPEVDEAIRFYTAAVALRPNSPGARLNLGVALQRRGWVDRAVKAFSQAIELKRDYWAAWSNRGFSHADLGRYEEALADHSRAIKLKPDYAPAWTGRGIAHAGLGRYDRALADHSRAIKLKPDHAKAWNNRGIVYCELRRYDRALADHSMAIKLNPSSAAAWTNRGATHSRSGRHEQAIADHSRAIELKPDYAPAWTGRGIAHAGLGGYEQALADHSRAIELKPDYAEAWTNRGNAKVKLRRYEQAVADHSKAIDLKPRLATAWYNRGAAHAAFGRYEQAAADNSRAIQLDPKYVDAWYNRGVAYRNLGQYDKAVADFSKAIELDPKLAYAWSNRGLAHARLGRGKQALADFSRAIELKPDFAEAWYNRGVTHSRLDQYEQAIADYSKAVELKPDHAKAWTSRGHAHAELGRYEQAVADHSRAIALKPDFALAWYNRGLAHKALRRYDRALADYSRAIELKPDYAEAWTNRGGVYGSLGHYEQALADLSRAIKLKPKLAMAWYNRGAVHTRLGRWEQAIADYTEALKLEPPPDFAETGNALARLRAVCPDPRFRDAKQALELARKAVDRVPKNKYYWFTLGAAHYRSGHWKDAVVALERSMKLHKGSTPSHGLLLAMAHWKLGDRKEAREWYDRAVQGMAKNLPPDEILRHLHIEAAALLGLKDGKAPAEKK
jgi:tetratricopeptide (TPR) repeat protein